MKSNYNITCYADLEKEEIRVRKRIAKLAPEIQIKLKQLPEEIVAFGITRMIKHIVSRGVFQSMASIIKAVKSYFFDKEKENTSEKGSKNVFVDIIENAIRKGFER